MKIVLLSINYWPEPSGIAPLATQLAEGLASRGHAVSVVTGLPNYPARRVMEGYEEKAFVRERIEGVDVFRCWLHVSDERTAWRKMLHHGSFAASCVAGLIAAGRPDVLLCVTPALPAVIPARYAARLWRVPLVLWLQDILPQAAVTFGLLRNRRMIAAMERLERFAYRGSSRIVVIGEGFRRNLLGKGVDEAKLDVVYNWVDTERVRPGPRENGWRHGLGFNGHPMVLYAGNMGFSQGLERVPEAAALLAREEVQFVLVGEGTRRPEIEARVRGLGLDNVRLLPMQPEGEVREMLAAADVLLVTQKGNVLDENVPSKIPTYLAAGRPVLAAVNPHGDAARIARDCEGALWIPPEDPISLSSAVRTLLADPARRERMGAASRSYAEAHFRRGAAIERFERILAGALLERTWPGR